MRPLCVFPDCQAEAEARGMCGRHYRQVERGTSILPPLQPDRPLLTEWVHLATCRVEDIDPELFFPLSEKLHEQVAAAKAVCRRCPVRAECLEFAQRHLPHGVAGGFSATERAELRARDLQPVAAGVSR